MRFNCQKLAKENVPQPVETICKRVCIAEENGGIILSNNIFHVHNSPPKGGEGGLFLRWSYTKKRKFLTFLQIGNLCASSEREGWPDQKYTIHSKVVVMVTKLHYPPW